jgi:hypothetical protein
VAQGIRSLGPAIGYHGCSKDVADAVLFQNQHLKASNNDHDWLGHGTYFWLDSWERALDWAKHTKKRNPSVVGAIINPGVCLNLADISAASSLKRAYEVLKLALQETGRAMPKNQSADTRGLALRRILDCAVIELLHGLRAEENETPYDTVVGVFEEGAPMFPGAAMKERTHVQIAVRNPRSILGYFKPTYSR